MRDLAFDSATSASISDLVHATSLQRRILRAWVLMNGLSLFLDCLVKGQSEGEGEGEWEGEAEDEGEGEAEGEGEGEREGEGDGEGEGEGEGEGDGEAAAEAEAEGESYPVQRLLLLASASASDAYLLGWLNMCYWTDLEVEAVTLRLTDRRRIKFGTGIGIT